MCTLIVSTQQLIILYFIFRKILGGYYPLSAGFVPGALCSFCAILVERKSRRGALALYMLNQVRKDRIKDRYISLSNIEALFNNMDTK